MNEIVQFKADTGATVEITPQDVVDYLCPKATTQEVGLFLQLCKAQRLNPWVGEAYLVKYADDKPAQIVAGKEAFTRRASANPDYEGFEAGVTFTDANGHIRQREGSAFYPTAGERLVGGWCRVYVKGRKPFYDEVALQEYDTSKSLWKSKPATMIRKVALVHCLREAFPDDFTGMYSAEEIGRDENLAQAAPVAVEAETAAALAQATATPAKAETCKAIGDMITELAALRSVDYSTVYDAVFGSKALQVAGFNDDGDLSEQQAQTALGLLKKWIGSAKATATDDAPVYETE